MLKNIYILIILTLSQDHLMDILMLLNYVKLVIRLATVNYLKDNCVNIIQL